VTDPWGDPVAEAYVQQDWEPSTGSPRAWTYTDAAGFYGFDNVPVAVLADDGVWSMEFSKGPAFSPVAREVTPPLAGTTTVDATLLYRSSALPASVRTDAGDAIVDLVIESWAPRPGTPGGAPRTSCAWVRLPGSAPAPASFVRAASDGRSFFSLSTVVPGGTPPGAYSFDHWLADCADASLSLSARTTSSYEVHNEALRLVSYGPTATTGPSALLSVAANRSVSAATIVVDGVEVVPPPFTGSTVAVPLSGLSHGLHTASVTISDGVETVGPVEFAWQVDALGPALSGGTPRGVIGDPTPELTVSASDPASIDRRFAQFVLTDPQGAKRYLRPAPSGDDLWTAQIEVPLTVAGPYVVTFQAWDGFGNYSDLTWSFEYRRLASFR
jgi:hypothetical protein